MSTTAGTRTDIRALADICEQLALRALQFGEIERKVVRHPDGRPETDSTHTVMLAWLAPALAALLYPDLDPLLVCAFAVVHDSVEVHSGDPCTIRITPEQRILKAARERIAVGQWQSEFGARLPWLPVMIARYEAQAEPEAWFVKAADKILTGLVHAANGARGLWEYGETAASQEGRRAERWAMIAAYASDFPLLLDLSDEVISRLVIMLREREAEQDRLECTPKTPAPQLGLDWAARAARTGHPGRSQA